MKVLITDRVSPVCPRVLREQGLEVEERPGLPREEIVKTLPVFEGLIVRSGTKVTRDVIASGEQLRVIGRAGVGVDNVDVPAASERRIAVVNTPAGNTLSVVEHTLALMLALARHVPESHRVLREGRWDRNRFEGIELSGKTLGVIGFGRAGREVARRARAFGMSIRATDPLLPPAAFASEGVEASSFETVLAESDFITLHVPLDPSTRGLLDGATLARCRRGVRIVNTSRGGVVDEAALLAALEAGQVAGAALDVFEQEPPPPDHPLLKHPRVVVTPHLGASTAEAQERVAEEVGREVASYLLRGEAANIVNRDALRR